jgi:hypothetical protein
MRFPDQAAVVLTTVLGGLILSDLGSHRALRRVLADAGELDRLPSQEARERSDHAAGTGGERLEL